MKTIIEYVTSYGESHRNVAEAVRTSKKYSRRLALGIDVCSSESIEITPSDLS